MKDIMLSTESGRSCQACRHRHLLSEFVRGALSGSGLAVGFSGLAVAFGRRFFLIFQASGYRPLRLRYLNSSTLGRVTVWLDGSHRSNLDSPR